MSSLIIWRVMSLRAIEELPSLVACCHTIKVLCKIQGKLNISSEGQETRGEGFSNPPDKVYSCGSLSEPWISNAQSSNPGQTELCGFWGLKRPQANSKTAHRTFFQTPDIGSASQMPLLRFEILGSMSAVTTSPPLPAHRLPHCLI